MSKTKLSIPTDFPVLLKEIKHRIQQAQTRAMLTVNAELVQLYWDIGRLIHARQKTEGWGAGIIPRLAAELRNELPAVKGFSERNIDRMIAFYRAYPTPSGFSPPLAAKIPSPEKVPQAVAKLPAAPKVPPIAAQLPDSLLWSVPWAHHVVLIQKVKDLPIRLWYMQQTLANGWSRNVLLVMLQSEQSQGRQRTKAQSEETAQQGTQEMTDRPEKLDLRSQDIGEDRRQDLLRLFPEVRTEGGKLDFERLKLALGQAVDVGIQSLPTLPRSKFGGSSRSLTTKTRASSTWTAARSPTGASVSSSWTSPTSRRGTLGSSTTPRHLNASLNFTWTTFATAGCRTIFSMNCCSRVDSR